MNALKNKATLTGTVTLVQKNSNTGVCEFRNLLSGEDISAWTSETNMATTEKVSFLEALSHKYRVPVQAHEFEITQDEAYFEFSFSRVQELQKELQGLGVIVDQSHCDFYLSLVEFEKRYYVLKLVKGNELVIQLTGKPDNKPLHDALWRQYLLRKEYLQNNERFYERGEILSILSMIASHFGQVHITLLEEFGIWKLIK